MSIAQVAVLITETADLAALTMAEIGNPGDREILAALTTDQIRALTTAQVRALTSDQAKALTTDQIAGLTSVQNQGN